MNKIRLIKRSIKHFYQRCTRGFDDSATWSLDITMFEWLKPRLEVLIQKREDMFESSEETEDLKKLLLLLNDLNWDQGALITKEIYTLFSKCLPSMWW